MENKFTKELKHAGYEQTIKFLIESKTIYFIRCTCGDFQFRRIKKVDDKIFAEPCKHLAPIVKVYEGDGFKLKEPVPMEGDERCSAALSRFLIDRSNGYCECGCGKLGEQVHRKIPDTKGGLYSELNCVLLNGECHKAITYQSWHASPGAKR